MAEEFFIPKLGQTVEEVVLVKWLVADGAKVSQGQEVMEVETDKAVFPVEANAKGYIHIGPFHEGETLPVLTVVAIIGKENDKFEVKGEVTVDAIGPQETASESTDVVPPAPRGDRLFASPRARKLADEKNVDLERLTPNELVPTGWGGTRVAERDVTAFLNRAAAIPALMREEGTASLPKVTPLAQRMAVGSGVDLRTIEGTGPGGKIVKVDVERATKPAPEPTPLPAKTALPVRPMPEAEVAERIPLKGVRSIIAERMSTSAHTTASVTLFMEVDASEFVNARERIKAKVADEWGFTPGFNDLLAKIVSSALRKFPYMNARLAPDAIELLSRVNIGMAVDTERGLLVPVVRDADQKSLRQFGSEFRQMVERARNSRSLPDDLSSGTFTITNLGMYEVDAFTPVINLPEAAILGVGRITPKVVPQGEKMAIRQMWTLCLVFDHRLVDGAPAARFLQYIKHLIEEPYLLIAG